MALKRKLQRTATAPQAIADLKPAIVRHIVAEFGRRGLNAAALLDGLGFAAKNLAARGFRVSYAQSTSVVRRAMRLLDLPHLGLRAGVTFGLLEWGVPLVGLMACADSREAIAFAVAVLPSLGCPLRLGVEDTDRGVCVVAEPLFDDPEVTAFLVDETFAAIVRAGLSVVGPHYRPVAAKFAAPCPPDVALHQDVFGAAISFFRPQNRLVFPAEAVPVPSADAVVVKRVRALLQSQSSPVAAPDEIAASVIQALRSQLRAPPTLIAMAASVHLDQSTLRRRLAALGLTYTGLVDIERRNRALAMMRSRHYALSEIADELGFADLQSLQQALDRWAGQGPTKLGFFDDIDPPG